MQLSTDDEELAVYLASGKSQTEAARLVGLHRNTVWMRLTNSAFAARVRELRRAIADQVTGKITEAATDAVASLALIASDGEDESNRLKAADMLLSHLMRFSERADVEDRLAKLEALARGEQFGNAPPGQIGKDPGPKAEPGQ